jgi:hypothetical protein
MPESDWRYLQFLTARSYSQHAIDDDMRVARHDPPIIAGGRREAQGGGQRQSE